MTESLAHERAMVKQQEVKQREIFGRQNDRKSALMQLSQLRNHLTSRQGIAQRVRTTSAVDEML
jgi:hypothetical protein